MKEMDISLLLKKAEELRALFVLGQRVIPFLEEIFLFVNEIKPLLDEINTSIKDNLKKMPNASKQLSKVTEATERSTTEIMDIVDGLFYKSDIISSDLNKLAEMNNVNKANPIKIIELISKAIETDITSQDLVSELTTEIQNFKNSKDSEFGEIVTKTDAMLSSIKDDSNSIMMSLQVQDITSQQIAAVNHLLQTVQAKLSLIMDKFKNSDIGELVGTASNSDHVEGTNISKLHRDIAFDPDAVDSITHKETRQGDIDAMIQNYSSTNGTQVAKEEIVVDDGPASQDDIDNMFALMNGDVAAEEAPIPLIQTTPPPKPIVAQPSIPIPIPTPTIAVAEAEDDFSDFSQDDIDALFGN